MIAFLRERTRRSAVAVLSIVVGFACMQAAPVWADTVAPKPVNTPSPDYPPKAFKDGVEGYVEVEFTVMPDGTVQDVSVVGADPPHTFEVAAVKAVSQWTFKPGTRDGAPVAAHVREKIDFKPGS